MTANPLEIRLLGRIEVLRGAPGELIELPPSKKARALLAYLVATERAHDRNYLAGLLWEERDDTRAALRWALSRLRPVLDDQTTRLVTDRDRVGFERKDAVVDLASVRHALRDGIDRVSTTTLEEAASRFRGDLLEGLDLSECYGFHAWCVAEREAARALRTSILTALVGRLADDPERALGYARTRLDLDPLSGTAQASVVRILGALGRQREAEQLYQSFKQMVQARLGERTSVELERARQAARTAPPKPEPSTTTTVELPPPVSTTKPAPIDRLARSPFVGREKELATLVATLDSAVQGGGGFVEIAGQAGVGKSRLVEELVHQARLRGARVMVGRCLEGDGSPAFLPFLDSLDAVLDDEATLERLVGSDAALAARISPRVAARLREPPPPIAADATSERYLVFQAVSTLLERIAAPAGALLVVEDLHWIDQPSLALLRYLVARLDGTRLLVVATYRDEDLDAKTRHALVDLRRHGGTRIALGGLAKSEVHALVDALGGSSVADSLRDRLAEVTGGHPLFLQEMLKHLVEENALDAASAASVSVPEGVRQVIERRLARLSERAKKLLVVASPMIGAVEWECVRALSDENEDDRLDALEEVMSAQLLREQVESGHATYAFSHALVAQTIYESLPTPRRARLNRQIGEALERIHASDLEPRLAALAHHFHLAGADGASRAKALDYAIRAGDRAASLLACEEAVRHWERALDIARSDPELTLPIPAWEIHRRRGRALAVVSAWNDACAAYEQALVLAPADAREWRAETLVDDGVASLWAMNMPGVYARAQHADELARTLGRPDLTVAIGGLLAQCLASNGEIDAAIAKYAEVRTLRAGRHVSSLSLAPLSNYWNGRIPEALDWAKENLDAARAAQDVVSLLVGLPPLGMALAASGRYEEAAAAFAEARAIGERHRAGSLLARAVSMSTGYHLDRGDVDTAEDLASEARELSLSSGWTPGEVSAGIDLAVCRLRREDVAAAERHLEESVRKAESIRSRNPGTSGFHDWLWQIRIAWVRTEIARVRAEHDDVERLAVESLRVAESGRPKYEVATLVTRAASRAKRQRTKDALADLDRALERAASDPALRLRAAVLRQEIDPTEALARTISDLTDRVRTP